jgi:hypothetical protein
MTQTTIRVNATEFRGIDTGDLDAAAQRYGQLADHFSADAIDAHRRIRPEVRQLAIECRSHQGQLERRAYYAS